MSLDLALVIRGDASSAGKAVQETAADVKALGAEAKQANEQSAASSRQAIEALNAQATAEKNLQAAINQRLGVSQNVGQVGTPFSQDAFRAAEIEAYGESLDALRAKFNPLFAAERQHAKLLEEINAAARVGAIDDQERASAIAIATAGHEKQIAVIRRMTGAVEGETRAFRLNRVGMLELQAAGINTFQALAAGMSVTQVAMMEGSQVIGAFVQGTEGGLKAAIKGIGSGLASVGSSILGTFGLFPIVSIGAIAAVVGIYEAVTTLDDWIFHTSADAKEFDSWLEKIGSSANSTSEFIDKVGAAIKGMSLVDLNKLTRQSAAEIKTLQDNLTNPLAEIAGTEGVLNDPAFVQTYRTIDAIIGQLKGDTQISLEDFRREIDDIVRQRPGLQRYAEEWENLGEKILKSRDALIQANIAREVFEAAGKSSPRPDFGEGAAVRQHLIESGNASYDALFDAKRTFDAAGLNEYAAGISKINQQFDDLIYKYHATGVAADRFNQARSIDLSAFQKNYLQQGSSYSSSVAQSPAQFRQALLQTFDPNLIASIIRTESSWNPNAYNSQYGAAGLGQFIPGTSKMLGINPYDPNQAIAGINTYLQQLLKQDNGNIYAAVAQYGGASKSDIGRILAGQAPLNPAVQDYLDKIFNPGPGLTQQLTTMKQWNATIDAATGSLKIQQGAYGQSFQAMDEAAIKQQLLAQYIAQGGRASDTAAKSIDGVAKSLAALDQQARASQFLSDLQFQGQQLGRTRDQQRVFADLRNRQIDINTPEGQAAAAADRSIIALTELKSTANDAFSALTGGLERGENAWQAMGDAATSVLDAIEKKLQDRLLSYLFDGAGTGGSGFFSWLGGGAWGSNAFPAAPAGPIASGMSLADWGFAGGGWTGSGGKFQPKGVVHAEEFVFDAASTAAIGVDNLYRLKDASRSGFVEGGYTAPISGFSGSGFAAGGYFDSSRSDQNWNGHAEYGSGATIINNWQIETPNPKAFAESRATVGRAAARLSARSSRYT